jgi:hypothetical protein
VSDDYGRTIALEGGGVWGTYIERLATAEAQAKDFFNEAYDAGLERDALQARIDAVKALHVREECEKHEGCPATCAPCYETWPCPTIQALTP